jgi:hypothetical protein
MTYYNDIRRGLRRTDALTTLSTSPAKAPDWQLNRVVSAEDTDFTKRSDGANASGCASVRFAVTPMTADPTSDSEAEPGGSGDPDVSIYVWSEQAKTFVALPIPITATGAGAGVPYVIDVPTANGSIVACFVTNDPGGVVAIAAQGFNPEDA